MSLTNVLFCFEDATDDIVCLQAHPTNPHIVLAGSQDNCLYIFDTQQQTTLAKIADFEDSVTYVRWVGASQFMACSLDGQLCLYQYDLQKFPTPILVSSLSGLSNLDFFAAGKTSVFASSEDGQFYLADYSDPTQPALKTCIFVDGLADFQVFGATVFLIGRTIVGYDYKANEQKQLTQATATVTNTPSVSYLDKQKAILLIGYDDGTVEAYSASPMKLHLIQTLPALTTAGVNAITSITINGNLYYFIGTNDAVYCYEHNLQPRNVARLINQGVSVISFQMKEIASAVVARNESVNQDISRQGEQLVIKQSTTKTDVSNCLLICGLTDGGVAVFDALSLERLIDFEVLGDEQEADKPVLAIALAGENLLITGDRRLYVYDADLEKAIIVQKQVEEEASLGEAPPDVQGAEDGEVQ